MPSRVRLPEQSWSISRLRFSSDGMRDVGEKVFVAGCEFVSTSGKSWGWT